MFYRKLWKLNHSMLVIALPLGNTIQDGLKRYLPSTLPLKFWILANVFPANRAWKRGKWVATAIRNDVSRPVFFPWRFHTIKGNCRMKPCWAEVVRLTELTALRNSVYPMHSPRIHAWLVSLVRTDPYKILQDPADFGTILKYISRTS